MSAAPVQPFSLKGEARRARIAEEQSARRVTLIKLCFAAVLGVCFWFSVPYSLPLQIDPDPVIAAAKEATAYQGSFSRQIAMPVIALVSLYLLWRLPRKGRFEAKSKLALAMMAYTGWAVLSAAWSTDPAISRKRLVVFVINALFVYTLARTTSVIECAWLGFSCTGTVALIALCSDFVQHTFAPGDPDYRFMGVMTANYQAINLVVCLLCGVTLAQHRPRLLGWLAPLCGLFAALLFLTRARIGTIICLAMLAFVSLRMIKLHLQPQARALTVVAMLMLFLPGAVFALGRSGSGALTSLFMMGRQDTENTASLSNRAPLWGELGTSVEDRPLLGFGFEAFWSPERVSKISNDQGWVVPHAHNTYLDQTLSLGLVGAFLYAAMLLGACATAWRRFYKSRNELALFPALLLTWLALLSLTESIPVAPCLPTLIAYACIVRLCVTDEPKRNTLAESVSRQPSPLPAQRRRRPSPIAVLSGQARHA